MVDIVAVDDVVGLAEESMWYEYGREELMFGFVDETEWCALDRERR
jgi:hypothetical protein